MVGIRYLSSAQLQGFNKYKVIKAMRKVLARPCKKVRVVRMVIARF